MSAPGRISTLFFDMDNTLFDLVAAQVASCREVAHTFGRSDGDELFSYFLRPDHGFESHGNLQQYLEERDIYSAVTYDRACRVYETEKLRHIVPYPGVAETLVRLRCAGYPMCIVTDARSRDATIRLDKTGLLPHFLGMISCDMVNAKKPADDPFLAALEMMKASPDTALLVGDSVRRDIEPCTRLGIRTVYARYGDRFAATRPDHGADFVIDRMDELPAILTRLNGA